MRNLILSAAFLFSSAAHAVEAYQINARDHSCAEIAQTVRQHKAVFVRTGFGGRSFRHPPGRCNLGDKYTTVSVRDANGQMCVLNYACVNDPSSFYNFNFSR